MIVILFSNQMDYVFWKYDGTGNRNIPEKEWLLHIHKDILNNILDNPSLLRHISHKFNISNSVLIQLIKKKWFTFQ